MRGKHKFILPVYILINLFQLFLELLNILLCMRIHLLKYLLRPFQSFNLILTP